MWAADYLLCLLPSPQFEDNSDHRDVAGDVLTSHYQRQFGGRNGGYARESLT
jgi:hypothetical protein